MKKVYLKVPKLEEMKYRQKLMMDEKTMKYNAGYDVLYEGYNRENGTINTTDEMIKNWYVRWIGFEPDKYYAYIYDEENNEPVGEVYYYLDEMIHRMGIVIEDKYRGMGYSYPALLELEKVAFEKNNISELSDIIPLDREGAIKVFNKAGFIHTDLIQIEKVFNKEKQARQLLITKEMYFDKKR